MVAATAWISSTMHRARRLEQPLRAAGQHQVQRLWRRDQDVGRARAASLALALRRVAGADGDFEVGADAAQRCAQVAVDVVGERLERRDVDEARAPLAGRRRRLVGELVDRVQERGQRLARAGRRRDQDMLAGGDRRPGLILGRCRRREGRGEPLSRAGLKVRSGTASERTVAYSGSMNARPA